LLKTGADFCQTPNFPAIRRWDFFSQVVRKASSQEMWQSEDWRINMKYAIVESGGKQYKAVEGGMIEVDRLVDEEGTKIDLERVLMVVDGDNYTVGTPEVDGVKVKATIDAHFKGPKIIVFKYHPKKRYRLKKGHRQQYTRLAIEKIG
jgi:large subunit ribosomal protein L21